MTTAPPLHRAPPAAPRVRVAHLCQDFSILSETFLYDSITELDRQGAEGHVVAMNVANREARPYANVEHTPWPGSRHPHRLAHRVLAEAGVGDPERASWPELRRRVGAALRRVRPDVLHAHFGTTGAVLCPLAERLGVPMVVSFHGRDAFVHPATPRHREPYARMFRRVDAVTVVSHLMQAHLVGLGVHPAKVHLVRVGKRVEEYPYRPPGAGPVREWVSVGRLTEKKGHLDALAAFREVLREHPDQRLRIVGEGEREADVRRYVREHGLGDHVELLGAVDHEATKAVMAASDAFVLCSRTAADGDREGVPTVLMEAQLLGLPCVTTTHSGIPEVIPEASRWLLSPEGDVAAIASAMRALVTADPAARVEVARAGRAKVEAEFNLQVEAGRILSLYESVTGRRHPAPPTAWGRLRESARAGRGRRVRAGAGATGARRAGRSGAL